MAITSAILEPNRYHSGVQSGCRPTSTKYSCWNLWSWISLCRARKTMASDDKWSQFYLTNVWRWLLPGVVVYVHLRYPKLAGKLLFALQPKHVILLTIYP